MGARPSVNDGPASPSGRKRFIFTIGARNGGKDVVTGDQGQGIERRRSPRVAVQKHATIAFRGLAFPCNLVDESESGVRLADFPIASCPDKFALHLGESEPRQCRVAWRSPVTLGVRYLEDERLRRLRQSIAHFEHLLMAGASAEMAAIYRAEIAAARTMTDGLVRDSARAGPSASESRKRK